jgi:DNA-binding winged helix-turn-helix (wHTH) protein
MAIKRIVYEFGPFRLDPEERRLYENGLPTIELRNQAFDLLLYLVKNQAEKPGREISNDELREGKWFGKGEWNYEDIQTLKPAFNDIYKVLKEVRRDPIYIERNRKKKCTRLLVEVRAVEQLTQAESARGSRIVGNAPPQPQLVIGRDDDLRKIMARLLRQPAQKAAFIQVVTTMWGLPGVGKSTLAAYLANDSDVAAAFLDGGPLWASLGQKPDLVAHLDSWGRALGVTDLRQEKTLEKVSERLAALLRHRRMLLIIDDVWQVPHAKALMVGGKDCAVLITTRERRVAEALATRAQDIYHLRVMRDKDALELLAELAPKVVSSYPSQSRHLVRELEGLPLALQVAGRLLRAKTVHGYDVETLLRDLESGAALLQEDAPADMADLISQTTPKVVTLLMKSIEVLDDTTQERFAFLGVVKEKPATFGLDFMKAQWQADDPLPTAEILVDRGLIEPVIVAGKQRYQMHALLVALASSMLE